MRSWTRARKWAIVVGVMLLCLLLPRPQLTPAGPILLLTMTASRTPTVSTTATTVGTRRPQYLPLLKQGHEPSTIDPLTPLPDLTIDHMYLEMEGRTGSCMLAYAPYGIRVIVVNTGDVATGSFAVLLNSAEQTIAAGLAALQIVELHFPGTVPSGQYTAIVDPADQVAESDESNNTQTFSAPTPSPPPICTPTPTGTPTPTPI